MYIYIYVHRIDEVFYLLQTRLVDASPNSGSSSTAFLTLSLIEVIVKNCGERTEGKVYRYVYDM
jgi:hypothetical protein